MQAIDKISYSNDWVTLLFLILLASIVLLKLIDTKKVKASFFAFFSFSLINDEDVESNRFFDVFQVVIFFFSMLVFSFLTYQFKLYKAPESTNGFFAFLSVFTGVFLYFSTKRILEYVLTLLFMIKSNVKFLTYLKNNYLYSISFFVYIALVLSEYTKIHQLYVFFFTGSLFIIRFIFLVTRNKKLIFNKLFYFILYLCALEIAPLFVLFKLMF